MELKVLILFSLAFLVLETHTKKASEKGYKNISFYENDQELVRDPCADSHCEAGKECVISDKGDAKCVCVQRCDYFADERRKVCSNFNTTWPSDCEMYKMRCLCLENSQACRNDSLKHIHIDYYGKCQKTAECETSDLADFPRRMREWLFNVMNELSERHELTTNLEEKIIQIQEEKNQAKKWSLAAVWKWCQLDLKPHDASISRHELFPLRAPLHTMEHCVSPFLDSCDADDDHRITLKEWISCLQLDEELIEDVKNLCEEIRNEV